MDMVMELIHLTMVMDIVMEHTKSSRLSSCHKHSVILSPSVAALQGASITRNHHSAETKGSRKG